MVRGAVIFLVLVTHAQTSRLDTPSQTDSTTTATFAADFSLKSIDGQVVRLKEFRGKVVVLNFWATWCPPCRAEIPHLIKLHKEYEGRGLRIVGITYPPANRQRIRGMIARLRVNYPILLGTRQVASLYEVDSILPVSIIIDREGRIIKRIDGIADPRDIESAIP